MVVVMVVVTSEQYVCLGAQNHENARRSQTITRVPTCGFLSILLFSKDNVQAVPMLVPVDTEGQAMLNEK